MQKPSKFPCVIVGSEALRQVQSKDKSKTFNVQTMYYWEHTAESFPSKFDQFVDAQMNPGEYDIDAIKSLGVRDGRLGITRLVLTPRIAVAAVPNAAAK